LAIRGGVASCQGFLSLVLVCYEVDVPHALPTAVLQFASAATLFTQWQTANPLMFLCRATASLLRAVLVVHAAACGRKWFFEDDCVHSAWTDVRLPFRLMHCIGSLRLFLNGLSLIVQFLYPRRGVGVRGNEQLFYRGFVRALGLPLHFVRAVLKLGELTGTTWERLPVEVGVNLLRGLVLDPIAAWSLLNQWVATGAGRRTDDNRTSFIGAVSPDILNTLFDYLDPHSGHINLLIRASMALSQSVVTFSLVAYEIDVPHKLPLALFQVQVSLALFVQYRTGNTWMLVIRAVVSFLRMVLLLHLAVCGRLSSWDDCHTEGWSDLRRPFRMLHCLAALRMFLNAISLFAQFVFPGRGTTATYGDEQLFYRGVIRATGIPIFLARGVSKISDLSDTEWERIPLEIVMNFIRCFIIIPIQTWSLFHQWRFTGTSQAKLSEEIRTVRRGRSCVRNEQLQPSEAAVRGDKDKSAAEGGVMAPDRAVSGNNTAGTTTDQISRAAPADETCTVKI